MSKPEETPQGGQFTIYGSDCQRFIAVGLLLGAHLLVCVDHFFADGDNRPILIV